jgi:hypothetical protein
VTPELYAIARFRAGPWAGPPIPRPFLLGAGLPPSLPGARKVVYIATGLPPSAFGEPLDLGANGTTGGPVPAVRDVTLNPVVRYVGSTEKTVRTRLEKHIRDFDRAVSWSAVWVISLLDSTPRSVMHGIEGQVGKLLKPTDNLRLPAAVAPALRHGT